MAVERTFSIIKPDATRRNLTGKINARFEEKGLRIVAEHGRDGFLAAWLDHREVGWAADLIPTLTNKEKSS